MCKSDRQLIPIRPWVTVLLFLATAVPSLGQTAGEWSAPQAIVFSTGNALQMPRLAIDEAEDLHLVWCEILYDAGYVLPPWAIMYRRFDETLTPQIATQRLSWANGVARDPSVVLDSGGGPCVLWWDDRNGITARDVYYTRLNAGGQTVIDERMIGVTLTTPLWQLTEWPPAIPLGIANDIIYGAYNGFWGDLSHPELRYHFLRIDTNGDPEAGNGAVLVAEDPASLLQVHPALACSDSGDVYLAWEDARHWFGLVNEIYMARFHPHGTRVFEKRLTDCWLHTKTSPSLDVTPDGSIVLTWIGGSDLYFMKVDCNGNVEVPATLIDHYQWGNFTVQLEVLAGPQNDTHVLHARRSGLFYTHLDSTGQILVDAVMIAETGPSEFAPDMSACVDTSGCVHAVWSHSDLAGTYEITYTTNRPYLINIDVVQIIDRSGSMSGSKIAAAKEAAKLFVDMMEEGDKIGIVSYSSSASVNFPLTEIEPASGQGPQTLFSDDMESGTGNWSAQYPWARTTSTYSSPTHCWTDSPSGYYSNNRNTSLTLNPSISLPSGAGAVLKFKTRYALESGYDYGRIEVSAGGGSWTQVATVNGSQTSWTEKSVPLSQYAGQSIRLRFRLTTDYSVTQDGWYIDDVEVISGDFGGTKEAAKMTIDGLVASGMTSIGAGLQAAWGQLQPYPDDPARAMILMSDGQHNTSPHPNSVLPSIASDVLIYTIGFGSGADATLMSHIAQEGNGAYYFAPTENELREIYFAISGRIRGEQLGLSDGGIALTGTTGHSLLLDSSVTLARIGIDWSGSDLDLSLLNPTGTLISHDNVDQFPNITLEIGATYEFYVVENPIVGEWQMLVDPVNVPPEGESYRAYALLQTPISIELATDQATYLQGDPIGMTVTLSDPGPITGADVTVEVTAAGVPDPFTVTCYDDGNHNDGQADDGVYGGTFTVTTYPGSYRVQAYADGTSNAGFDFHRTIWQSVAVNPAADPDNDGMPSDWEQAHGLDPIHNDAAEDPDVDGLPNIAEYQNGTDPQNPDTDYDGWEDGEELVAGSDPLDPNSVPMEDATDQVSVTFEYLRWDRRTRQSTCLMTIINDGIHPLGPDLHFVNGNIDPGNVTLLNADGTNSLGLQYVDVSLSGSLQPGQSVSAWLAFHNANRVVFTFNYGVWATSGSRGGDGGGPNGAGSGRDGDSLGSPSDFSAEKQALLEAIVEDAVKPVCP